MYPRSSWSTPILAPLLLTALAVALALVGCTNDPNSNAQAAQPLQAEPAKLVSLPAPATPPAAPGPTESSAPAKPEAPASEPAPPTAEPSDNDDAAGQAIPSTEVANPPAPEPTNAKVKYLAGEDPEFAKRHGWPVKRPATLPGSILPEKRIVAYYGNPLSKRMGALGEYPKEEMLRRLQKEVARWEQVDPSLPVQPALHLIAVVAQGAPGKAGKYRMVMPDTIVNQVYGWAKETKAIFFIDIQTGHDNIRTIVPRFEWLLKNPDVHLAIDPEFNLIQSGRVPGSKIGTYDAADINYVSGYLKELVQKYELPPKVFIVHRFTRKMVTNAKNIRLYPEVQIIMNMDGWGAPLLKRDSYKDYIVAEPVEYTGFKLFYHNDTKKGDPLLTPREVLKLTPKPLYIQYQ
jgi:hypothetical protein